MRHDGTEGEQQPAPDGEEDGYAAVVRENPYYPHESAEEAAAMRARRDLRQTRD